MTHFMHHPVSILFIAIVNQILQQNPQTKPANNSSHLLAVSQHLEITGFWTQKLHSAIMANDQQYTYPPINLPNPFLNQYYFVFITTPHGSEFH